VWSVTSWNELRRDAVAAEQEALLDGDGTRTPFITQQLMTTNGPVIAVSDWMRAVPDMISRWVPGDYSSLGTDGFGRSDTRAALRRHFRTDPESITVGVLRALARVGEVDAAAPDKAVAKYDLRSERVPASKDTQAGSSEVSG
jgi:pyruvate dehydrogenase E1 component